MVLRYTIRKDTGTGSRIDDQTNAAELASLELSCTSSTSRVKGGRQPGGKTHRRDSAYARSAAGLRLCLEGQLHRLFPPAHDCASAPVGETLRAFRCMLVSDTSQNGIGPYIWGAFPNALRGPTAGLRSNPMVGCENLTTAKSLKVLARNAFGSQRRSGRDEESPI